MKSEKKETKAGAPAEGQLAEHAATWTPEDPGTCTTCKRPVDDRTVHTTLHVGAPAENTSPSASVARAAVIEGVIDGVQTPDPISDPSKRRK
jgi:hypothetical protein